MYSLNDITALGTSVRQFDNDRFLTLYHYEECSNDSPDNLKAVRGLVFDGETLVFKSFPYTPEYTPETLGDKITNENISKYIFFQSFEGTIIRLFFARDKWYVSTHKKLSAFESRWGCGESFGTIFKEAIDAEYALNERFKDFVGGGENDLYERFLDKLDKTKGYLFLVRNTMGTRIVSYPPSRPLTWVVGVVKNGEIDINDDSLPIAYPPRMSFQTVEDVLNFVRVQDPMVSQGLVVYGENNYFKITSDSYTKLALLRGNEPSVRYRYLQVRRDFELCEKFVALYSEYRQDFQKYEDILVKIRDNIYEKYVSRFIHNQFAIVPKEQYKVLQRCHSLFLENRQLNKISRDRVMTVLNQQTPTELNRMIKPYLRLVN